MASRLVRLVRHLRHLLARALRGRVDFFHLALCLETHGRVLHAPAVTGRDHQRLHVVGEGEMAWVQGHHGVYQRDFCAVDVDHVARQAGADRVLATPAEADHADLPTAGGCAPQCLEEIHADLVGRRLLVARHPHQKRGCAGEHARVQAELGLLRLVGGDQEVGDLERHGVALEEVGHVDQIFAAFGIGVCDESVVGQGQAKDVGVDHDDAFWTGAVADHVGVQAMDHFFGALGLAAVDCALRELGVSWGS